MDADSFGEWLIERAKLEGERSRLIDRIDERDARIQALETSLATVQRAAKTIMIHEADELRQLRDERVKWHQAIATLDSERQANAMLTDRVEALETSLAEALRERTEARAEAANLRADLRQAEGRVKEARRQALEEAAKVAARWDKFRWNGIDIDDARDVSAQIAQAIRALASDPLLDRQGDGKEGV